MCNHFCRCGETEFCVLCYNNTYRTNSDYNKKIRLVLDVCEIRGEETIDCSYKYLCDEHRIGEDECLLIGKTNITEEERKKCIYSNRQYKKTYSIQNKKEMLSFFSIPENMIKLEYFQDKNDDNIDNVYISKDNYNKIKDLSNININIIREEDYK